MERGPEGCSAFTAEVAAASLVLDNCDIKVRAKPLAPPVGSVSVLFWPAAAHCLRSESGDAIKPWPADGWQQLRAVHAVGQLCDDGRHEVVRDCLPTTPARPSKMISFVSQGCRGLLPLPHCCFASSGYYDRQHAISKNSGRWPRAAHQLDAPPPPPAAPSRQTTTTKLRRGWRRCSALAVARWRCVTHILIETQTARGAPLPDTAATTAISCAHASSALRQGEE